MKIVIRAGGTGTRLWPMSRQHNPKQFQTIVGGESMIKDTYQRVSRLAADSDIFVSINQSMMELLLGAVPEILTANIIKESASRNTGPAMCLEVCFLSLVCGADEVIASLPSDDFISDPEAFARLLKLSENFLQDRPDYILTPAVKPAYVDVGYSYFKAGDSLASWEGEQILTVAEVVEKPDEQTCRQMIASGQYYCHTGMYIWKLGYIKQLFNELQPAMTAICEQIVTLMMQDGGDPRIAELYGSLEKISIESAITDQVPNLAMCVSDNLGWSDLGKWHIIKRMLLSDKEANLTKGRVLAHNAKNNLIYNNHDKKVIVVNGLDDLIVVDTPDGLFISASESSADVKDCVTRMKDNGWLENL